MQLDVNALKFICAFVFAVTLMAGITSCSTNNTADHMSAIEQNQPIDIPSLYKEQLENKGLDVELYLLEKGRIAQLQNNFEASRASFNEEVEYVKKRELGDNTLPGADINVGSVLVNDNMLAYKARLFELEMVYLYQSYNYLALGDLEGAMVEIRLAEFLLNEAEKAREREDFKEEYFRNTEDGVQKKIFDNQQAIQKGAMKNQIELNGTQGNSDAVLALMTDKNPMGVSNPPVDVETVADSDSTEPQSVSEEESYRTELQKISDENFAEMSELLGKTKSSVLNPYVVYVGGVIHEMSGELEDAYISYKKSLELMPSNPYLQREVIRMAIKLDKTYDFDQLKTTYPEVWKQIESSSYSEDSGRLIVIYEDGWTPQKQEIFITLGAVAIAYPVYKFAWTEPQPMLVSAQSGEIGNTAPICYLGSLALRALQEEAKWRIIRQAARATAKASVFAAGTTAAAIGGATGNNSMQLAGLGVMAASSIYNNLSENADLRCWMTLPENVQILVSELPSGEHKLTFAPQSTQLKLEEIVTIRKGHITLVWVVHVGESLDYECLWPRTLNSGKRGAAIQENNISDDVKTHTADKL